MLHFVEGVYNTLFSTPEYHVLLVGRECAGKSTLLEQLKFLYTSATQQQEEEQLQVERRAAEAPAERSSESSTSSLNTRRPTLPPGTPLCATPTYMSQKRIRPTVGLNYAVVQHRFSPPVAVLRRVKKSELKTTAVSSLPPPPADIIAEQRVRQQALLANAPSDAVTRVVLRDLGGQAALRELWEKYYAQTQALVYVVDSTLPFRSFTVGTSSSSPASAPQLSGYPLDHLTEKELEEIYKPDRQLLARLLQHPLLNSVPVLLLSNKTDETPHVPLAKVQEALCLADLASDRTFYARQHFKVDDAAPQNGARSDTDMSSTAVSGAAPTAASLTSGRYPTLARHCNSAEAAQRRVGESGFGEISMRIVEVSALDGTGVAGAMDWLVAQLLFRARCVGADV
ncbi:hypothetical protein ABL78_6726 [Leptomonas seymouri]|uniref:ADP-ribosylation factor-like protein n=1 Tax=Leptomonas seymouri TaxID=5684 RepID=A0A0N1HTD1_LEPSE|nr:hypothetical protein ABL78_6726 [Leptomonas seymouri]|eukprot:KPI84210.1 hypothetical protein ABL78_6726 [Leptomonas seymouri]